MDLGYDCSVAIWASKCKEKRTSWFDKPYHINKRTLQKEVDIEILRNCALNYTFVSEKCCTKETSCIDRLKAIIMKK